MRCYFRRWPARRRLACLLLSVEDVSAPAQILDYFPALTDRGLVKELQRVPYGTNDTQVLARQERLSSLSGKES